MMNRTASLTVAALVLSGCTNWKLFEREGAELASQTPAVVELLTQVQSLGVRATALPAELPGRAEALQRLTQTRQSLESLQSRLIALPSGLAAAIKVGKKPAVVALLTGLRADLAAGLASGKSSIAALGAQLTALEAEAQKAAAPPPPSFTRDLPGGFSLSGSLTGIEALLLAFIEDGNRPVDKTTWFDFDRLVFETGSATLDMKQSKEQLVNVAEILKAFPAVKVKVGGYTDNVGALSANRRLSTQRAINVATSLGTLGVAPSRLDPEGYGPEHPVCPANDTEACRAQNRRISLRVTAK